MSLQGFIVYDLIIGIDNLLFIHKDDPCICARYIPICYRIQYQKEVEKNVISIHIMNVFLVDVDTRVLDTLCRR